MYSLHAQPHGCAGTTMGDDPHFSITLPDGKLLCYTVQGTHGFSFNLINSRRFQMNALFVPDSRHSEVTWIGSLGMIVHQEVEYQGTNTTKIKLDAKSKEIRVGEKLILLAKKVNEIKFERGKIAISLAKPTLSRSYPSVRVNLKDLSLHFTVIFYDKHLDMFWHSAVQDDKSHGLIGKPLFTCTVHSVSCLMECKLRSSTK